MASVILLMSTAVLKVSVKLSPPTAPVTVPLKTGLAVPKAAGNAVVRNRIKRQLREVWRARLDGEAISRRNDYVLVVRQGLPEAAEKRGHEWLGECVDEVLAQAGTEAAA